MEDIKFKYELFFNLSPDLLCIAGYDGYFKKVNPAVSNVLEYSFEELYSRPINDFVYHDDKDITDQVRSDLTKSIPLFHFENRYQTKSGEIVWLAWTSYPVEKDKLIFAIAKNITQKKLAEEQRSELLNNLTAINQHLKQMTYTTSHDLRSPISGLLSGLDEIDITKIDDEETAELIKILQSSGKYIQDTLNNYLDILTEKHQELAKITEVDLNESLKRVLKYIIPLIKNSNASIHSDFSRLPRIKFNKEYLESLYLNLISNSIKYSRPDVRPIIKINSERSEGKNKLIVSDNGLGFNTAKVKDKIFGFKQTFHDHKDSKGIGLYLVYNHVTSLGGDIKIESKVNEGTTFIISFKDY